jgi:hypothetical protein
VSVSQIDLPEYSAYFRTPAYSVDGAVNFGLMQAPVSAHPTDELYRVPPGGESRLDLIADDRYGSAHLWWVLASVNNIMDPMTEPAVGTFLRVPSPERLVSLGVMA